MDKPPAVVLSYDPAGPQFPISEQCEMPKITVTATLQNVTPDPKLPLQFQWKVNLTFTGQGCVHSLSRVIKHPDISQVTPINKFTIPFTQIRGGDLAISVTVRVGNVSLTAQSQNLQVTGTNPSIGALQAGVPANDTFRKLMRVESGLRQFLSPTCPYFSSDNYGGVGICQVTKPAPTDDQVWSWKENVKAGWNLYQEKENAARGYPAHVRQSGEFQALVTAYNNQRLAKQQAAGASAPQGGQSQPSAGTTPKPLMIELPDYTADQLQRDTVRGYNGYAGGLHEYRVKVDSNGLLVVTEDATGSKGTAEWEPISAADRTAYYDQINLDKNRRGDPNYVDDVEAKASF